MMTAKRVRTLAMLLIAGCLAVGLSACSRVSSIVGLLEKGEYQKASEIYYKKAAGNSQMESQVENDIRNAIEQYIDDYNNNARDETAVKGFLDTVYKSDILAPDLMQYYYRKYNELVGSKYCFEQAAALEKEGKWLDAADYYAQVIPSDSLYQDALEKRQKAYEGYVASRISAAEESQKNGGYEEAYAMLTGLQNDFPEQEELIRTAIDNCIAAYCSDIRARAEEEYKKGNYQGAFDLIDRSCNWAKSSLMEDHAKYKEALDAENERKIKEAVDAAVDEAKELISKKKWSEAYNVLAKASGTYSGREELKTAIADLKDKYAAALIKSADKLSKEGKHLNAIEKIDGAYSWLDARKEITDARQKYTDAYIKETIKKAKSAFEAGKDKKDYKKAISVLQTAVNKIGWNEKLNKEIEKYQEYIPVDLTTLEPYHESKWIEFKKDVEDSLGNTYSTGIEACNGDQFMTWDLGGRYTVLTAKGIIERWDRNISTERKPSTLRIYGDDVLLYEKTDIKSTTKPYDIKVDITGVTDLRIETSTPSDMGYNSVEVYLVDVFVQK